MSQEPQRLQKVLAGLGLGSRREIESWIEQGRVTVNGKPAELGVKITEQDNVRVDGKAITLDHEIKTRVLMYHKPVGEICSHDDPEDRATVYDKLPKLHHGKWISIGRLDINTSGLLLFTNNGELANKLMHPSNQVAREYSVRVLGEVDEQILERLQKGVTLEDGLAQFERIEFAGGDGANRWYNVLIREGRNREVRRLWEACGITVSRLIRIRLGPIRLPKSLPRGRWQELTPGQIKSLQTNK